MFELPEVETTRRELDRDLVGKKVKTVEATSMKVLGRYKARKAFTSQLDDMNASRIKNFLEELDATLGTAANLED